MIRRSAALCLVLACAAPGVAAGQHIYTCRDKNGHMLTSDQPIPECSALPMEERSRGGMVVREIAAPLTPEQIAAQALADKKKKEDEEQARDQRRRDLLLLSTYSDEQSIEVARARALADFQDSLRAANEQMASMLADREALKKEAAPYHDKPLPAPLQHRVDVLELQIASGTRAIEDRQRDIARINARFDADAERFKVLEQGNSSVRH